MSLSWPETMPEGGRLSGKESDYAWMSGLCLVVDPKMSCPQTLNVTLFFDGTNNNNDINNPRRDSRNHTHTNVARLFNASVLDPENGGFPFYIPGVGTPLPEIGEHVYTSMGKAMAKGFSARCVLGYVRLLNAVYSAISEDRGRLLIRGDDIRILCQAASAHGDMAGFAPHVQRLSVAHKNAVDDHRWPRTVRQVWINVIGFSRGAACARAFVHRLVNQWAKNSNLGNLDGKFAIPYQVNFMGLFDTVASVGLPDSARAAVDVGLFAGHEAFAADGAMDIPPQVRFCRHAFSIHEQRMSFPLDSIRKGEAYPAGVREEIIYPGVHSDVGGGYAPGEQGKGRGENRSDDSHKLSQIPLHDMYIAALKYGVPLMKGREILQTPQVNPDFALAPETVAAFNGWLNTADRSVARIEDAIRFGMGQMLSWRTLRAQVNTGAYVTQQPFFKAAQEDPMTPRQLAKAFDGAQASDPQLQELNARISQAEQKRTLATRNTHYPANVAELAACQAEIDDATEAVDRRKEALYGELAHKSEPARKGEDAYSVSTNDKTDLLQGAEEMRLLLGHLHPHEATSRWQLQVAQPVQTPSNQGLPPEAPASPGLRVQRVSPLSDPANPGAGARVDSPQMRLVDRGIAFHTIRTTFAQSWNADDDVISTPHGNVLPFLRQHTAEDAVKTLPKEAIALYDDYVHDSRCWFRVPYFHEYAPGGYGWPRVVFIGGNERARLFGFDPLQVQLDPAESDTSVPA